MLLSYTEPARDWTVAPNCGDVSAGSACDSPRVKFALQFKDGGAGGCSPPPPTPNVMFKQLRFKTLVVKFPREPDKILYFFFKPPPPPTRNSALPSL